MPGSGQIVGTYASREVIIIVDDQPISGTAKGTKVTIKRTTKSKKIVVGSDSEAAIIQSADFSGTISVPLMQTSASNTRLSQILAADEVPGAPTTLFNVSVQDLSGNSLHEGLECAIEGWPDTVYAEDEEAREWVFLIPNLENFLGGNH